MTVSPLALLKNPMILLALVAMVFMFGMPKLMQNSASSCLSMWCCLLTMTSGPRNARGIR